MVGSLLHCVKSSLILKLSKNAHAIYYMSHFLLLIFFHEEYENACFACILDKELFRLFIKKELIAARVCKHCAYAHK